MSYITFPGKTKQNKPTKNPLKFGFILRCLPRYRNLYIGHGSCNSAGLELLSDWKEFSIGTLSDFCIEPNREYILK